MLLLFIIAFDRNHDYCMISSRCGYCYFVTNRAISNVTYKSGSMIIIPYNYVPDM